MQKLSEKGIANIIILLILLIGIPAAVYLAQRTQIFKPRATFTTKAEFVDASGSPITQTSDPNVRLRIIRQAMTVGNTVSAPITPSPTPTATPSPTPTATPAGPPSAPTGLTATAVAPTQIKLTWNSVAGADVISSPTPKTLAEAIANAEGKGYKRYRCAGSGCTPVFNGWNNTPPSLDDPYFDYYVNCGTTYTYKVTANNNGESGFSNTASATTPACGPGQSGPPVCTSITGPSNLALNQEGTFTFNYTGLVNAIQYGTKGGFPWPPAGTFYPPQTQLNIRWSAYRSGSGDRAFTGLGTFEVNGFVITNFSGYYQSNCPPKTVTIQ